MKFAELKDLTEAELGARANELRREYFNLRLQQASAQLEKTARLRVLRKDVARIETALTQRRKSQSPAT
jgi:large subunit ribosomal protein L29